MKTLPSTLGNIYFGSTYDGLGALIRDFNPGNVFILADENTNRFCTPLIADKISVEHTIVIPDGEKHKSLETCEKIWSQLIEYNADRHSMILNVGGGVVCDIGGFAASCYMRGIPFVHIPTSVLAMADAAIGGKNGIDFQGLKNYLGLIRSPEWIWIETEFLGTLPLEQKKAGLSEIVKHAIIGSPELWNLLKSLRSIEEITWLPIFEKNIPVKIKIVESDPFEKGIRKVLNFGHTIGHALESYYLTNQKVVLHGSCVATGMLVESKISNNLGLLNKEDFNAIVILISQLLEPVRERSPNFEELYAWMAKDKKKRKQSIEFSLPDRIGSCGWDIPVEKEVIASGYEWLAQAGIKS